MFFMMSQKFSLQTVFCMQFPRNECFGFLAVYRKKSYNMSQGTNRRQAHLSGNS